MPEKILSHKVIDHVSRHVIVEGIKASRHCHNIDLIRYVYETMTYDQAVLTAVYGPQVLNEESTQTDVQKEMKLKQAEKQISSIVSLPLSILVGGMGANGLKQVATKTALMRGLPAAQAAAYGAAKASGFMGIFASIGTSMALSFGIALLSKVIMTLIHRRFGICHKKCDSSLSKDDEFRKHKFRICYHKCRISQIQALLRQIIKEKANCSKTNRPDRCMKGLYDQEVKFRDMLETETKKIMRAQENLKRAIFKKQKQKSDAPKIKNLMRKN